MQELSHALRPGSSWKYITGHALHAQIAVLVFTVPGRHGSHSSASPPPRTRNLGPIGSRHGGRHPPLLRRARGTLCTRGLLSHSC